MTIYTITVVKSPSITPEERRRRLALAYDLLLTVGEQIAVTVDIAASPEITEQESRDSDMPPHKHTRRQPAQEVVQ